MEALTTTILKVLTNLSPFVLAAVGWLGAQACKLLQARTQNELLNLSLRKLGDVVKTVSLEMQQTIMLEIRERSADGVLSREDMVAVKQAAIDKVCAFLGVNGVAVLGKAMGLTPSQALDFIQSKIEASIPPTVPPPALPPFYPSQQAGATSVQLLGQQYPVESLPPFLQGPPPKAAP